MEMFKFDNLSSSEFSWEKARIFAYLSNIAYEDENIIRELLSEHDLQNFEYIEESETQSFVISNNDFTVITFRGTDGIADWFGNLDVFATDLEHGKVHSGFYEAYKDVEEKLKPWIERAMTDSHQFFLTGHSLGGAIALITAIENFSLVENILKGIYTFGQPKTTNGRLANFLSQSISGKYQRFLNDDDIVPRVPPGYRHSGQLIHFNADGNPVMRNDTGEGLEAEEHEGGISQEEFEEIKSTIQSLMSSLETIESDNKEEMLDASVEGLFPSFSDHSMDKYLRLIRKQANVGNAKLATEFQQVHIQSKIESLEIRREAEATGTSEELVSASRESTSETLVIPALLQTKVQNWSPPEGIKINSQFGSIVSVQSETFGALRELENDPDVLSIEVSRDAGIEELEDSIPFVGADNIHRPNIQEKGNSALVGVIDTGIDILHDCFTDQNGQTRIMAIWDQRSNDPNLSPADIDANNFMQSYGRLYLQSEINKFRNDPSNVPTALRDFGKHGTHVASIAAGRSVGNDLKDGMAPESGIIVVIPNMKTNRNDPPSLGYSSSHVDALNFLKIAAAGNNAISNDKLPIAVNVSLGMNAGAHDGTSLLEIAFDASSNNGRDPGFVVIKSAGNERGHGGHARIRTLGQKDIKWDANDNSRFQDYFEAWYSSHDELQFLLTDPSGNQSSVVDLNNTSINELLGGNRISLTLQPLHQDNGDNRLVVTVEEDHKRIQTGVWTLTVTPIKVRSQNAFLDMWVER